MLNDEFKRDRLLTAEEVASRLNMHLFTIYRLSNRGELLPIRIGRQLRFSESEIETFIAQRKDERRHVKAHG